MSSGHVQRIAGDDSGVFLVPAGASAAHEAALAWWLIGGATLAFVAVMLLLAWALPGRGARAGRSVWWLVGGGLLLPALALAALQWVNQRDLAAAAAAPPRDALLVSVHGRLWWWELRIDGHDGAAPLVLANELHLPVGRPVRLALASDDVIHSLWLPALAGKVDLVPGRINHLLVEATRPGRWAAPCAEFCGTAHTAMVLRTVALPADEFERWLTAQRADAREAATPLERAGRQHFIEQRCSTCHTIRGVAVATLSGAHGGPDLTHLGSREHLGAGSLRNDADGLRRWITGVQHVKPGARMPSYAQLDAATLDALVAYLGSLQ
jgi:cytochrome c oxidase subunit 2